MLNLTLNTALEPDAYERGLLADFVDGTRTLDDVVGLLDGREKAVAN